MIKTDVFYHFLAISLNCTTLNFRIHPSDVPNIFQYFTWKQLISSSKKKPIPASRIQGLVGVLICMMLFIWFLCCLYMYEVELMFQEMSNIRLKPPIRSNRCHDNGIFLSLILGNKKNRRKRPLFLSWIEHLLKLI